MTEDKIRLTAFGFFLICVVCITSCQGSRVAGIVKVPHDEVEAVDMSSLLGFVFDGHWQFKISNPEESKLEIALFLEDQELLRHDMSRLGPVVKKDILLNVALMDIGSKANAISGDATYEKKIFASAGNLGAFAQAFSLPKLGRNSIVYLWEETGNAHSRQKYELMALGNSKSEKKRLFLEIRLKELEAQQDSPADAGQ